MTTTKHVMNTRDVADLLRVTRNTVAGLDIPRMRRKEGAPVRFNLRAVERWIRSNTHTRPRGKRYVGLPSEPFLTAQHVADALSISRQTAYGLRSSGHLSWLQVGGSIRFDPREVESYVERNSR